MKLQSRFSIAECQSRLAASIDIEKIAFTMSGYAGTKELIGRIDGTNFRVTKRRNYRNSFAPYFYGRFEASGTGTVIEGDFRIHPAAKIFMICWFSFLALFVLLAFFLPAHGQPDSGRLPLVAVAAGMAAFGIGLVRISQRLGSRERQPIVDFLQRKFETVNAD